MASRTAHATALITAAVTAFGVLTAPGSASPDPAPGPGRVTANLRNDCAFPLTGGQVVVAGLTADLPRSVTAGWPVRPEQPSIRFVFPETMLHALKTAGAAWIDGTVAVGVTAKHGDTTARAAADGGLPRTALPESGELAVELPAKPLRPVATTGAGAVAFTLGPPQLVLTAHGADDAVIGDGGALTASCVPQPGQDPALGAVQVLPVARIAPSKSAPVSPPGTAKPDVTVPPGAPVPGGEGRRDNGTAAGPVAECGPEPPDLEPALFPLRLKGHATIRKLRSGIDLGPGHLQSEVRVWPDSSGEGLCNGIRGDLQLPPARASFVVLRFVSTTATVEVLPVGKVEGVLDQGNTGVFTGHGKANLRLSNVEVNGTPLEVGPNCGTATPVELALKSEEGKWSPIDGGVMEADFTIPPFAGCGVTEPLEPLFDYLISGPDNHITFTFPPLCFPPDCPPDWESKR
ncbi:DUF6801 domain-containing protein [Amycolatopsis anabasis]|uniref:DUF6801 domain-containing protein n=1 Tax=Amycolatopsis anabasis TaxID=1840409 RepID=UPI00131EA4CF|nr:DUF6801 domain-containing protein [Amycolatopsis anabasis]